MSRWDTAVIMVHSHSELELLQKDIFSIPAVVRILVTLARKGIKQAYLMVPDDILEISSFLTEIIRSYTERKLPKWYLVKELPSLPQPFLLISSSQIWHPNLIDWFDKGIGSQNIACAVTNHDYQPVIASVTNDFLIHFGITAQSYPPLSSFPLTLKIPPSIACIPTTELLLSPKKTLYLVGKPSDRPHVIAVRHMIYPFLKFCAHHNIHPNLITWLGFIVHLTGCGVLIIPGYLSGVIAAVILIISWIIDCADGTLARLTYQESPSGQVLDTRVGHLSNIVFFLSLIIRIYPPWSPTQVAITCLLIGGIVLAGLVHSALDRRESETIYSVPSVFSKINHRDYTFVLLAFAIFNSLKLFLWIALVGIYCYVLAELLLIFKTAKVASKKRGIE